jgi:molybdopterin converting factor subunit 1
VKPLKITIRLFANYSELLQKDKLTVELPDKSTVGDLRAYLHETLQGVSALLDKTMIAVNREYADMTLTIHEGDEIALIPPVGGGSPEALLTQSCKITHNPLRIEEAYQLMEDTKNGGVVVFAGTVREWTKGRQTINLTYDAYVEMASAQMHKIEQEVKEQFPDVKTLQWHRIGLLYPTDTAVICAAASPHRDAAFEAARMLIERLKKEVAIWKKEQYADGEAIWQPNES